jgi:hypothetical protein
LFRPSQPADLGALVSLFDHDLSDLDPLEPELARSADSSPPPFGWVDESRVRRGLDSGNYRYDWTWIAELDGRILARAVWWGAADATQPTALHCLLVERSIPHPELWGAALLRSAHAAFRERGVTALPGYAVEAREDWRADSASATAIAWRQDAARAAGIELAVLVPV